MKETTVRCDFCGASKPDEQMGTLSVPMNADEQQLAQKCGNKNVVRGDTFTALMLGFSAPPAVTTRTFDICRPCADGLIRARATLTQLRKAIQVESV